MVKGSGDGDAAGRGPGAASRPGVTRRGTAHRSGRLSVLVIAVAAALWATDAYFRGYLLARLGAAQIVLGEDLLIAVPLAPVLWLRRRELRRLGWRGWVAAAIVGAGPQAIATVMFTASLAYKNFAVSYVLQQTQPLIAVLLAGLLLGERRRGWYWPGLIAALAGAYLVVFAPDLAAPVRALPSAREAAAALALGAAALWALGTVLGRYLLRSVSFPTMTSLRVTLALPVLAAAVLAGQGAGALAGYRASQVPGFLGLALIPGLLALLLYYRALSTTPASLSTIAEMAYPVTATIIASAPAPAGFGQTLYPAQLAGTALLACAIGLADWGKSAGIVSGNRQGAAAASVPARH
jgi:DME family drug/metabolite transporter